MKLIKRVGNTILIYELSLHVFVVRSMTTAVVGFLCFKPYLMRCIDHLLIIAVIRLLLSLIVTIFVLNCSARCPLLRTFTLDL